MKQDIVFFTLNVEISASVDVSFYAKISGFYQLTSSCWEERVCGGFIHALYTIVLSE